MGVSDKIFPILIFLFIIWIVTGGVTDPLSYRPTLNLPSFSDFTNDGGSEKPPAGTPERAAYDIEQLQDKVTELQNEIIYSPLKGKLTIETVSGVGPYGSVGSEYVAIRANYNNTAPIRLTGFAIKSVRGATTIPIGQGAILPYTNTVNSKEDIYLQPGGIAYLISGDSPIGTSFRLNKCTGYFAQNQSFNPYLPTQCPTLSDERKPAVPNQLSDDCLDFLDSVPRCRVYNGTYPDYIPYECKVYIRDTATYPNCVTAHKNDRDFYQNEWRVYFKRTGKIWNERRDTLRIVDADGKIINEYTYRY